MVMTLLSRHTHKETCIDDMNKTPGEKEINETYRTYAIF